MGNNITKIMTMHNSKVCFKCNEEKCLSEFYKHKGMSDGHLNKCKKCARKDVSENRIKNIDYYMEYDKTRSNNPNRINARDIYAKTEKGKSAANKAKIKWAEKNIIKQSAHILVGNYVRDRKLIKLYFCECCGKSGTRIHGHHDDYAYPLVVRWLCSKCHSTWHKLNGEAKNG